MHAFSLIRHRNPHIHNGVYRRLNLDGQKLGLHRGKYKASTSDHMGIVQVISETAGPILSLTTDEQIADVIRSNLDYFLTDFEKGLYPGLREKYLLSLAKKIHGAKIVSAGPGDARIVEKHYHSKYDNTKLRFDDLKKSQYLTLAQKLGTSPVSSHFTNARFIESRYRHLPSQFISSSGEMRYGDGKTQGSRKYDTSKLYTNGISKHAESVQSGNTEDALEKTEYESSNTLQSIAEWKKRSSENEKKLDGVNNNGPQSETNDRGPETNAYGQTVYTIDPNVKKAILSRNTMDILKTLQKSGNTLKSTGYGSNDGEKIIIIPRNNRKKIIFNSNTGDVTYSRVENEITSPSKMNVHKSEHKKPGEYVVKEEAKKARGTYDGTINESIVLKDNSAYENPVQSYDGTKGRNDKVIDYSVTEKTGDSDYTDNIEYDKKVEKPRDMYDTSNNKNDKYVDEFRSEKYKNSYDIDKVENETLEDNLGIEKSSHYYESVEDESKDSIDNESKDSSEHETPDDSFRATKQNNQKNNTKKSTIDNVESNSTTDINKSSFMTILENEDTPDGVSEETETTSGNYDVPKSDDTDNTSNKNEKFDNSKFEDFNDNPKSDSTDDSVVDRADYTENTNHLIVDSFNNSMSGNMNSETEKLEVTDKASDPINYDGVIIDSSDTESSSKTGDYSTVVTEPSLSENSGTMNDTNDGDSLKSESNNTALFNSNIDSSIMTNARIHLGEKDSDKTFISTSSNDSNYTTSTDISYNKLHTLDTLGTSSAMPPLDSDIKDSNADTNFEIYHTDNTDFDKTVISIANTSDNFTYFVNVDKSKITDVLTTTKTKAPSNSEAIDFNPLTDSDRYSIDTKSDKTVISIGNMSDNSTYSTTNINYDNNTEKPDAFRTATNKILLNLETNDNNNSNMNSSNTPNTSEIRSFDSHLTEISNDVTSLDFRPSTNGRSDSISNDIATTTESALDLTYSSNNLVNNTKLIDFKISSTDVITANSNTDGTYKIYPSAADTESLYSNQETALKINNTTNTNIATAHSNTTDSDYGDAPIIDIITDKSYINDTEKISNTSATDITTINSNLNVTSTSDTSNIDKATSNSNTNHSENTDMSNTNKTATSSNTDTTVNSGSSSTDVITDNSNTVNEDKTNDISNETVTINSNTDDSQNSTNTTITNTTAKSNSGGADNSSTSTTDITTLDLNIDREGKRNDISKADVTTTNSNTDSTNSNDTLSTDRTIINSSTDVSDNFSGTENTTENSNIDTIGNTSSSNVDDKSTNINTNDSKNTSAIFNFTIRPVNSNTGRIDSSNTSDKNIIPSDSNIYSTDKTSDISDLDIQTTNSNTDDSDKPSNTAINNTAPYSNTGSMDNSGTSTTDIPTSDSNIDSEDKVTDTYKTDITKTISNTYTSSTDSNVTSNTEKATTNSITERKIIIPPNVDIAPINSNKVVSENTSDTSNINSTTGNSYIISTDGSKTSNTETSTTNPNTAASTDSSRDLLNMTIATKNSYLDDKDGTDSSKTFNTETSTTNPNTAASTDSSRDLSYMAIATTNSYLDDKDGTDSSKKSNTETSKTNSNTAASTDSSRDLSNTTIATTNSYLNDKDSNDKPNINISTSKPNTDIIDTSNAQQAITNSNASVLDNNTETIATTNSSDTTAGNTSKATESSRTSSDIGPAESNSAIYENPTSDNKYSSSGTSDNTNIAVATSVSTAVSTARDNTDNTPTDNGTGSDKHNSNKYLNVVSSKNRIEDSESMSEEITSRSGSEERGTSFDSGNAYESGSGEA